MKVSPPVLLPVLRSRVGRNRMLRAAAGSIVTRPLTDLLAVTFGPLPVLSELLATVPGIDAAYIYGSWAARYDGEAGPLPPVDDDPFFTQIRKRPMVELRLAEERGR